MAQSVTGADVNDGASYQVGNGGVGGGGGGGRPRNRARLCCCLFHAAKRIGASGLRAVFGDTFSSSVSSAGGAGRRTAAGAAASAATSADQPLASGGGFAGRSSAAVFGVPGAPPPPRGPSGLVGLENQGATCYLNSLVQVLAASPELRRAIFAVTPEQLGLDEHGFPTGEDEASLRQIPYQLQRLIARVLLSDSAHVSTEELTGSFGWQGRQLGDQHDAQELSRLLLHALEESLVDTGAYQPIKAAVAGEFTTGVECLACGLTSSRTEEFLDVCLTTVGYTSLEDSLHATYGLEKLEGSNQYRCDRCAKMVDAKKFCRLERLPPILSLSLMRFNYDLDRMQRVKNDAKFAFPAQLDMRPHMSKTASGPADQFQYELYAVIAHCGSAMGGHYRAFVLDMERRGLSLADQLKQQQLQRQTRGFPDSPVNQSEANGSAGGSSPKQSNGSRKRQWFMFSDTQVRPVQESAIKDQFSGHECAYMLFYRRQADVATTARLTEEAIRSEMPAWLYKTILEENEILRRRREEYEIAANTVVFDVYSEGAFSLGADRLIWEKAENECQAAGTVSIDCRLPVAELVRRVGEVMNCQPGSIGSVLCLEHTASGYFCVSKLTELPNSSIPIRSTYQPAVSIDAAVALLCLSGQADKSMLCGEENRPVRLVIRLFNQSSGETHFSRSCRLAHCLRLVLAPQQPQVQGGAIVEESPAETPSSSTSQKKLKAELERVTVYHRRACAYASYPLSKNDEIARDRFKKSLHELGIRDGDTLIVRSSSPTDAVDGGADSRVGNGASFHSQGLMVDVTVCLNDAAKEKTMTVELKINSTICDLKMAAVQQLCREDGTAPDRVNYKEYCLLIYNDMLGCYCPEYEGVIYRMTRHNARPAKLEKSAAFADNDIFVRVRLLNSATGAAPAPAGPVASYTVPRDLPVGELRRCAAAELVGPASADAYHLCFYSPAGRALDEIKEGTSLTYSRVRHRSCLCLIPGRPILTGRVRIEVYEKLPFDSVDADWLAVLTNEPGRLFAHRLSLDFGEWDSLQVARASLGGSGEPGDPPLRLYSFQPAEARLVSVLHEGSASAASSLRRLADPGFALCYERKPPPPPSQSSAAQPVLLYLTEKGPDGRYPPPAEFWWDAADDDSAAALHRQVAQRLGCPASDVRLAKRLHHSCSWRPLPDRAASLRHGEAALRDFDVVACMRACAAGSTGLDRFDSPEDERLQRERGGGGGGADAPGAAAAADGAPAPQRGSDCHERGLVINVPKYAAPAAPAAADVSAS